MELTNGHAGGNGVWVDDEVWHNAVLGPGHIFLRVGDANGALLPMPTGKLVTHLWYPDRPHLGKQRKDRRHMSAGPQLSLLSWLCFTPIRVPQTCKWVPDQPAGVLPRATTQRTVQAV